MRYFSLVILLLSVSAHADAADEIITDLLHSDVPLWGYDDNNVWPRHFSDDDGSFGCAWRVKLGDWKLTTHDGQLEWIRLSNYGVFHCFTMVSDAADEREKLGTVNNQPSYFINLGQHSINGRATDLWVLQQGGRPGSNYTLLAKDYDEKDYKAFDVLQIACPESNLREGPSLDILSTRYCAINSKQEMAQFAAAMAELPPFGKMTLEVEAKD